MRYAKTNKNALVITVIAIPVGNTLMILVGIGVGYLPMDGVQALNSLVAALILQSIFGRMSQKSLAHNRKYDI